MPVPYTEFDPSKLRAAWKNGDNLKAGCTTSSYSGGTPSAATDLKPSICDHSTGNIKKGLTTPDDTALKPSVLLAPGAENPITFDKSFYYVPNYSNGGITLDPTGGYIECEFEVTAGDTNQRIPMGFSEGGNSRGPSIGVDVTANDRFFGQYVNRTTTNSFATAKWDQRVTMRIEWAEPDVYRATLDGVLLSGSQNYSGAPPAAGLVWIFGGWNLNNDANASWRFAGTIYRCQIVQNNGNNWDTNVDGWGELNGTLPPPAPTAQDLLATFNYGSGSASMRIKRNG